MSRRLQFPAAQKMGKPIWFLRKSHCNAGHDMNGRELSAVSYQLSAKALRLWF
jgi:hypothetical protein